MERILQKIALINDSERANFVSYLTDLENCLAVRLGLSEKLRSMEVKNFAVSREEAQKLIMLALVDVQRQNARMQANMKELQKRITRAVTSEFDFGFKS